MWGRDAGARRSGSCCYSGQGRERLVGSSVSELSKRQFGLRLTPERRYSRNDWKSIRTPACIVCDAFGWPLRLNFLGFSHGFRRGGLSRRSRRRSDLTSLSSAAQDFDGAKGLANSAAQPIILRQRQCRASAAENFVEWLRLGGLQEASAESDAARSPRKFAIALKEYGSKTRL